MDMKIDEKALQSNSSVSSKNDLGTLKQDTAEKITQPETQVLQEQPKGVPDNVVDIVSFHSKLSKSPFETASLQKSLKSSKLSARNK